MGFDQVEFGWGGFPAVQQQHGDPGLYRGAALPGGLEEAGEEVGGNSLGGLLSQAQAWYRKHRLLGRRKCTGVRHQQRARSPASLPPPSGAAGPSREIINEGGRERSQ